MIRHVAFLTTPMKSGDVRDIAVWADEPSTIAIKCFVQSPPPPGFKECPTCGTFSVRNGCPVKIIASEHLFKYSPGSLNIVIEDNAGDVKSFNVDVKP